MNPKTKTLLAAAALLALAAPAWALNKCTGPDGKVSFQDDPCEAAHKAESIDPHPASGAGVKQPAATNGAGKPMTEAERLNALSDASAKERRKRDLTDRLVPGARADVQNNRANCQRIQAELRADQYAYQQNLYGKTHAAQRASEMAASAAQCDTKDRELVNNFNTLMAECAALGGCAGITPP